MRKRRLIQSRPAGFIAALLAVASLTGAAHADVLFGSFEGSQPDGWGAASSTGVIPFSSNTTGATYSYDTLGATNGTTSLHVVQSGYANVLEFDFVASGLLSQFKANDIISFDVTYPASSAADGYRQIESVTMNGDGAGYQGGYANFNASSHQYPPFTQLTQTLSFNYDSFKNALSATPGWAQMTITLNDGGSAPTDFYFDNFRLSTPAAVPEPASCGVLAVGAALLLRRRR